MAVTPAVNRESVPERELTQAKVGCTFLCGVIRLGRRGRLICRCNKAPRRHPHPNPLPPGEGNYAHSTLALVSGVSWSGPGRWLICCPERWWLLTGQRCAAPSDKRAGPSTGSGPAIYLISAWASPELAEGQHVDLGPGED